MFRLWFKTFFGAPRFDENHLGEQEMVNTHTAIAEHDNAQVAEQSHHGVHESPWIMLLPLAVLAVLSLIGGWIGVPAALGGSNHFEHFLDPVFLAAGAEPLVATASHATELALAAISVATALLGLAVAYFFYVRKPGTAAALAQKSGPLYTLVANKFYVDELYHGIFAIGLLGASRALLSGAGEFLVDGAGNFLSWMAMDLGEAARRIQSGNLRSYAGWLALGAAAVMAL